MLAVLVVLSVHRWPECCSPTLFRVGETEIRVGRVITVLAIAVGVTVALRGGFDRDPAEVLHAVGFVPHADRGLGVDAPVPAASSRRPVLTGWHGWSPFLDPEVIDAYVRGTPSSTRAAGWAGSAPPG